MVQAGDSRGIEVAFAKLVASKAAALLVGVDSLFFNRRLQFASWQRDMQFPPCTTCANMPKRAV